MYCKGVVLFGKVKLRHCIEQQWHCIVEYSKGTVKFSNGTVRHCKAPWRRVRA